MCAPPLKQLQFAPGTVPFSGGLFFRGLHTCNGVQRATTQSTDPFAFVTQVVASVVASPTVASESVPVCDGSDGGGCHLPTLHPPATTSDDAVFSGLDPRPNVERPTVADGPRDGTYKAETTADDALWARWLCYRAVH